MIREFGSPTSFLTLSCAKYQSANIERYLQKVNEVPAESYLYLVGRLCTEDPISASQKFSQKSRDFFIIVLLQGQVLEVMHYLWKKIPI